MATITIDGPTADELLAQAKRRGVDLERHVRELAEWGGDWLDQRKAAPSDADIAQWFRDLRSGEPITTTLPPDFSRADIYDDHD